MPSFDPADALALGIAGGGLEVAQLAEQGQRAQSRDRATALAIQCIRYAQALTADHSAEEQGECA